MYTCHCEAVKQCAFECLWQRPFLNAIKPEGFASISVEKMPLFRHASHATSRGSHPALVSFSKQLPQIGHYAAAPDIRATPFIWLFTLHINMPSIDHRCHVVPSGLKKYGWEAHDGKSYGRQELYDEHFHLTTSWVSVYIAYLITTAHC